MVKQLIICLALSVCSWAVTPPTLVSYTDALFTNTGASKASGTVTWQTGDIVVVIGGASGSGNNEALGTPTATGLTFTDVVNQNAGNPAAHCPALLSTATAASGSSGAITVTHSSGGATINWGFGVWVWRGSGGLGNHASQTTSTDTKAMSSAQADSGIVWGSFDFNASATGTVAPTPTNTRNNTRVVSQYTYMNADLTDQPSTGSISYGTTGATGPFSIVVLEIKGTGGAACTPTLTLMGVGRCG